MDVLLTLWITLLVASIAVILWRIVVRHASLLVHFSVSFGKYSLSMNRSWNHPRRWWSKTCQKFIGHPVNYETRLRHWPWWKFKLHLCPAGSNEQCGLHLWIYCRHGGKLVRLYHPTRWRHLKVRE